MMSQKRNVFPYAIPIEFECLKNEKSINVFVLLKPSLYKDYCISIKYILAEYSPRLPNDCDDSLFTAKHLIIM